MKRIILLLLFSFAANAQEHNIWYFGSYAGLDFNTGTPMALTNGQLSTLEGSASVADAYGNLLFYTDGLEIWNKEHGVMQNGDGLMGDSSSIQSALIVKKPNSETIYYVFTTNANQNSGGFRYSVVDMEGDGGLGAVTEKNILLHVPTTEAVNVAWHSNGEDIWVVAHNYGNNIFSSYLVTDAGVSVNPVTSASGYTLSGMGQCSMKLSPDGSKLAFAVQDMENGLQLFDFNSGTGVVSNPVSLSGNNNYGLEFSPSGTILYTGTIYELYQYDLQANDINASRLEIFAVADIGFSGEIASLQRAPDNKIYIARKNLNTLSVINNPDVVGLLCDFQEYGINLGDYPHNSMFGLPNTILSPQYDIHISETSVCAGQELVLSLKNSSVGFESYVWDFGDGTTSVAQTPGHSYTSEGKYIIKLTVERGGLIKIIEKPIEVFPVPEITQLPDIIQCDEAGNGTALFNLEPQKAIILTNHSPDDYIVSFYPSLQQAESGNGELALSFMNTQNPQTLYARMQHKDSGCFAITSFRLIVASRPEIDMADIYWLCKGSSIQVSAPEGLEAYSWSTGETTRTISIDEPGSYTITVSLLIDGRLCENSKTFVVNESQPPVIKQINRSDWTDNQNKISVVTLTQGSYEYSLDGSIFQDSPDFSALESGIYTVYVRDKNGCGTDKREVVLLMYPKYFTPNGDNVNDVWRIKYSWHEPDMKIYIYDRYGRQIISFNGDSGGWDGKYNGADLPATDYWFLLERQDGRQQRGHFSLIR